MSEQEHDSRQLRSERGLSAGAATSCTRRDLLSRIEDAETAAMAASTRAYQLAATATRNDLDFEIRFKQARQDLDDAIDRCLAVYGQVLTEKLNNHHE